MVNSNFAVQVLADGDDSATAVIEARASHTYADLRRAVGLVVAELEHLRLEPGSRVAIAGANSLFWIAAYLAVMRQGYVAVPVSTNVTPSDLRRSLEWVGCRTICIDRRLAKRWQSTLPGGATLITDAVLASPEAPALEPALVGGDSLAALMFTSGTTARPKVVQVSHGNLAANTESIVESLDITSADRMLVVLPFFYCYGASLLHTHLRKGGSLVLCNTFSYPETALDMLAEHECTGIAGVPSSYQLLLRASSVAERKLPTLRKMLQAGGKLQDALIDQCVRAQPDARFFVMYGQTEATSRLSYLPPELLATRQGSIGRGIPGVTLRVADDDGVDVAVGQVGEIRARGPNITKGYWNDPEGTAEKFVADELLTGDLGKRDEDGFIYIVGRKADFIKSWGYRVSAQEVESCIQSVPQVLAAAVIGVPDPIAGEAIIAYCQPTPGSQPDPDRILAVCRAQLSKHMVPQEIRIAADLPLNAHGKVDKAQLRSAAIHVSSTRTRPNSEPTKGHGIQDKHGSG